MGSLFSQNINNDKNNDKNIIKPTLKTTLYCYKCRKTLFFNDYYKHIPECNLIHNKNNLSIIKRWEDQLHKKI